MDLKENEVSVTFIAIGIAEQCLKDLALLYLTTGRFTPIEEECGFLYRIPEGSDFSESKISESES